ncbi:MAG: helix-turn-helix domain-containing protein [Burkholderiales bacterium]|nr:helix-turn-helix domain-containing protein [Burkholderiales bacterium]
MIGEAESPIHDPAPEPEVSTGARLREARNAAGLSIDAVAQQLKLAPRQVKALEDDDFASLPGRTFVRGFLRNYARLVRLDPETILASLPDAAATPSLDHPSLAPTTRVMGELPAEMSGKHSSARWAIALALLAIAAIAVVYQYAWPLADQARGRLGGKAPAVVPAPDAAAPAAPAAGDGAATAAGAPNPAAATNSADAQPASAPEAAADDRPLVLVFRGTSWVEVKDAHGAIVLSTIGYPGATNAVGGATPLEVVLGNAEAVSVTWRGAAFDMAPFVKQNVAKFVVK